MGEFKETKEELEETKGEKFKKKLFNFLIIEYNLFLAGYPAGKIIGRISSATLFKSTDILLH